MFVQTACSAPASTADAVSAPATPQDLIGAWGWAGARDADNGFEFLDDGTVLLPRRTVGNQRLRERGTYAIRDDTWLAIYPANERIPVLIRYKLSGDELTLVLAETMAPLELRRQR